MKYFIQKTVFKLSKWLFKKVGSCNNCGSPNVIGYIKRLKCGKCIDFITPTKFELLCQYLPKFYRIDNKVHIEISSDYRSLEIFQIAIKLDNNQYYHWDLEFGHIKTNLRLKIELDYFYNKIKTDLEEL